MRSKGRTAWASEKRGDPNIVDVHTLNERSVTLAPLNLGATNLIFVDDRSIAITNVRIVVLGPGDV